MSDILLTPMLPADYTVEIPITLRAGVEHRWRIPNVLVLSHVYGQKPRFKWLAPIPPAPGPVKRKMGRPRKHPQ
jgi:hypothetical protein